MTTVNRPGSLGKAPFAAGGTAQSFVFVGNPQWSSVSFFTKATAAGTVQLFRIDQDGQRTPIGSAIPVGVIPDEDQQVVAFGFGAIQADYVNTDATAGLATFEARTSQGT